MKELNLATVDIEYLGDVLKKSLKQGTLLYKGKLLEDYLKDDDLSVEKREAVRALIDLNNVQDFNIKEIVMLLNLILWVLD